MFYNLSVNNQFIDYNYRIIDILIITNITYNYNTIQIQGVIRTQ